MKKKILFINFGGIGDEILFLPSIISVKKEYPDSQITLALEPRSKGILSLTSIIDNIMLADIKYVSRKNQSLIDKILHNKYIQLFNLLCNIWKEKFDIVVSSGANKFISLFLFFTFIKTRIGYNSGWLSERLLTRAVPLNKDQYAAKMYHDLVRGITNFNTELPEIEIERQVCVPNTVLIHPGVSLLSIQKGMIKTIPAEIWAEVVEKLANTGKKVIVAGGPDDKNVIETIERIVPCEKYTNMYGKTRNLKELAELISGTEIFLCSDSAPLHIAAALGTKTYVIFGPTDDKKLIPDNDKITPVKAFKCECMMRPCLWEKRHTTCQTLECLQISSDDIVRTVLNI